MKSQQTIPYKPMVKKLKIELNLFSPYTITSKDGNRIDIWQRSGATQFPGNILKQLDSFFKPVNSDVSAAPSKIGFNIGKFAKVPTARYSIQYDSLLKWYEKKIAKALKLQLKELGRVKISQDLHQVAIYPLSSGRFSKHASESIYGILGVRKKCKKVGKDSAEVIVITFKELHESVENGHPKVTQTRSRSFTVADNRSYLGADPRRMSGSALYGASLSPMELPSSSFVATPMRDLAFRRHDTMTSAYADSVVSDSSRGNDDSGSYDEVTTSSDDNGEYSAVLSVAQQEVLSPRGAADMEVPALMLDEVQRDGTESTSARTNRRSTETSDLTSLQSWMKESSERAVIEQEKEEKRRLSRSESVSQSVVEETVFQEEVEESAPTIPGTLPIPDIPQRTALNDNNPSAKLKKEVSVRIVGEDGNVKMVPLSEVEKNPSIAIDSAAGHLRAKRKHKKGKMHSSPKKEKKSSRGH